MANLYNVLLLDDGDVGWDVRVYGPYRDHDAALAGGDRAYHYARSKGYREECNDYWIFVGLRISDPAGLEDRSRRGRCT
jgi:hypothetical protein